MRVWHLEVEAEGHLRPAWAVESRGGIVASHRHWILMAAVTVAVAARAGVEGQ